MKKVIFSFIVFLCISTLIILLWSYGGCINKKWHEKKSMEGYISYKFVDSLNHNAYSLRIDNQDVYRIMGFNKIHGGNKIIYDSIMVGDSLIKKKGSLDLIIIRDDVRMIFTHDTGCNEDWWKFWEKF